ncbi:low affinity immunoglobulin gamma Fc region receptor II-a-like isoform X3 [Pseudoliparis swirei]|uniref:low affinity immunoglobulin gamma Fc region receptor II-a-like isoform X3 n=1 Tax=Pseudoliparis swirei TaxID=2059687 RepID=UPI0024BE8B2E|nr:low affinity immunoglobulin gamma Fc region receptor II-a-like isoform X3 [Pseudoliparis swirei]
MRMGLTVVCVPGLFLMNILLYCGHAQDIWLYVDPYRSAFFTGESVTFTCSVTGEEKDWYYSFRRDGSSFNNNIHQKTMTRSVTPALSGEYQCFASHKRQQIDLESNKVSITVSGEPKPVLTAAPSWPSPGGSVTLTCSVDPPSAGWRFFWYRVVPLLPASYRLKLLPGSTNGTERNSYTAHGHARTAGYACRAARGDPVFRSSYSEPQFVWSADFHPAASLTVSPPRMQFFSKEPLSLSCEGNSTEWRVSSFIIYDQNTFYSYCSHWGTMTGPTCTVSDSWTGVYWCESETGQFSNAANITIQSGDVILVSSVHPVTEGQSVTLGCRLKTEELLHHVDFYKNGKLIPDHSSGELFISEATKSDEGFYKCEARDSTRGLRSSSPQSWMSVKSAAPSSPFPVLMIVGLVSGVSLIILLLLFLYFCYRRSKDSRIVRSESTNQSAATDHVTNQDETQNNTYASPFRGKSREADEDIDYSDGKMASAADDGVMYAQVHPRKRDEGRSRSAAADETVYSEIKPGTTRDQ